jgi:hypothetical protein
MTMTTVMNEEWARHRFSSRRESRPLREGTWIAMSRRANALARAAAAAPIALRASSHRELASVRTLACERLQRHLYG